eukprot:jgi/Botrbrau1/19671/Bobra.0003s0033.1
MCMCAVSKLICGLLGVQLPVSTATANAVSQSIFGLHCHQHMCCVAVHLRAKLPPAYVLCRSPFSGYIATSICAVAQSICGLHCHQHMCCVAVHLRATLPPAYVLCRSPFAGYIAMFITSDPVPPEGGR